MILMIIIEIVIFIIIIIIYCSYHDNDSGTEKGNSRFLKIYLHDTLPPSCMLTHPGHSHMQIICKTLGACQGATYNNNNNNNNERISRAPFHVKRAQLR